MGKQSFDPPPAGTRYNLSLYITGASPQSVLAVNNIKHICETYLPGQYDLEIIDVYQQPGVAISEQIIAAPTLVKKSPLPVKKLIGDMSDTGKVLLGMGIVPETE